jgi:DNA-directed RNA polymerase specialized sigma24 family protein
MKISDVPINLNDPGFRGAGPLLMKLSHKYMRMMRLSLDDAFQEIALHFFRNIHRYDESRGKISTFVWCVARSAAIRYREKHDNKIPYKSNVSFDVGYSEDPELQSVLESLVPYVDVCKSGEKSNKYLPDKSMRSIAKRYHFEFSDIRNSNIREKSKKSVLLYTQNV